MTKLWKSKLPASRKVRLLRSTAFVIASYGSESWTIKLADKKRIDSVEMWCCYRRILRISWTERKTNTSLRADIITRKLSYFGHITRHQCLQKKHHEGYGRGKEKKRKTAASWLDDIKLITGKTIMDATRAAADCRRWRIIIRTTPALIYATWPEERESDLWPAGGLYLRQDKLFLLWLQEPNRTIEIWTFWKLTFLTPLRLYIIVTPLQLIKFGVHPREVAYGS